MGTKIYKIIKLVFGRYLIITFTAVWIVAGLIFNVFDVMGEKQKMQNALMEIPLCRKYTSGEFYVVKSGALISKNQMVLIHLPKKISSPFTTIKNELVMQGWEIEKMNEKKDSIHAKKGGYILQVMGVRDKNWNWGFVIRKDDILTKLGL